jgi:glucose-6-phosphate isomerase
MNQILIEKLEGIGYNSKRCCFFVETADFKEDFIMANWNNLDTLSSYKELKATAGSVDLTKAMAGENGAQRVKSYSVPMAAGLSYNYAAKSVDDTVLDKLAALADEAELVDKYAELYNGAVINTGEKRLVLHQLCRGQLGDAVVADGVNKFEFYKAQQAKVAEFANKVHAGEITNAAGEKFTTVVQIGIGGSDLGPRAIYLALENWAKANNTFKMEAKFISNVDPDDAAAVLNSIDVAHSLFVLVSKSGTTLETLTNESFVKNALANAGLDASKHMIAVTSETSPLAKSSDYLAAFFMDDYIGGRFSSSSAVGGAVLSLAFGPEVFARFLDGAAKEDKLAANKNIKENPALLDALIGVYERNVLGYPATAVLPYSQALSRFPAHLQQVDMESNGKSVNRFGEPVNYVTGPIIFGEPGTNGQHSFYQLLHQGTDIIPLQFIGFKKSQIGTDVDIQGSTSQQKLCANVAAQIIAFAVGKDDTNNNKKFAGNRPSSIIVGDQLTPEAIGAILSHFENKVMFQGFTWNINSFDQEGVQLGKVLAKKVLAHDTDGALKVYSDLLDI